MATNSLQSLFSYNNVKECENTLNLAYAIREVLQSANFQDDKRIQAALVRKNLEAEITAAEDYWLKNGGANQ